MDTQSPSQDGLIIPSENMEHTKYMDTTGSTQTFEHSHNYRNITQGDPNIVPLNLTAGYAQSWDVWEGVRELVQNWHDGIFDAVEKSTENRLFCTYRKVQFQMIVDNEKEVIYQAYVSQRNQTNQNPESFGYLIFDKVGEKLTLVNQNIALERKILLLGYSSHTKNKDVIGQFGEGLKIGALALVRAGLKVSMTTKKEEWRFGLHTYDQFDNEEGLAVFVTKIDLDSKSQKQVNSQFQLGEEDTATTLYPLKLKYFEECRKRFLFLTNPDDAVETEMGTLLLDDRFSGQLYVKGIWVSDLSQDNLHTGVDFCELKIDRDRKAVPQLSEIDHKISSMWPRALEQRRDLAQRYYNLLSKNPNCRDVKHAQTYSFNETTAALMAEQFRIQNPNAFPVMDSHSWQELQGLQDELQVQVVSCNQALLHLLHKSGRYRNLDEARAAMNAKKMDVIPLSKLDIEDRHVLEHAVKLTNLVDPDFRISLVDVINTENEDKPMLQGERLEIPIWMLNREIVHKAGPVCIPNHGKCMCREIRICNCFLHLRKVKGPGRHPREPQPDQALMKVLSKYISEECGKAPEFCQSNPMAIEDIHERCTETHESLEREFERLKGEHISRVEMHKKELERLKHEQDSIEKELKSSIVKETDPNIKIAKLQEQYEKALARYKSDVQQSLNQKEGIIQAREREVNGIQEQVEKAVKKYNDQEAHIIDYNRCLERKHSMMVEKITQYRKVLSDKAHSARHEKHRSQGFMSDLCKDVAFTCHEICSELEGQAYVCVICKTNRRAYVFLPCGHFKYCEACASTWFREHKNCPECRTRSTDIVKVYE